MPWLLALPLIMMALSGAFRTAGNFYSANKANELYNAQVKDMQSYLDNYLKQNHLDRNAIKHPYMGTSGQINALHKSIEVNQVMPWLGAGATAFGSGASFAGAYANDYMNTYHPKTVYGNSGMSRYLDGYY